MLQGGDFERQYVLKQSLKLEFQSIKSSIAATVPVVTGKIDHEFIRDRSLYIG